MNGRLAGLPPRALVGIAAGVVLVYALALWFLLVTPKRAEATILADDVVTAELRLADARLAATRPPSAGPRVGDVLRLAKAMPSSADQPGLVLELDRLARSSGVKLDAITTRDPVQSPGAPIAIPVVVNAEGSYRQITTFIRRARELVRVRGGEVRATGRLFTVQAIELSESKTRKFPYLSASITMNAYVYDRPIVPATPPPAADAGSDDLATGATAAKGTP